MGSHTLNLLNPKYKSFLYGIREIKLDINTWTIY
jgi:hypothetical protein